MQRKNELTGSCHRHHWCRGDCRNPIDSVVRALSAGFKGGQWASHIEPVPIPSKIEIIDLIEQAQRILFPGFFSPVILRPENTDYHLGQQVSLFYENTASRVQLGHPPRLLPPRPELLLLRRAQLPDRRRPDRQPADHPQPANGHRGHPHRRRRPPTRTR